VEEGYGVEGFGLLGRTLILLCFRLAYVSEIGLRGGREFSWSFKLLLFGSWLGVDSIEAREENWENVRIGKPS